MNRISDVTDRQTLAGGSRRDRPGRKSRLSCPRFDGYKPTATSPKGRRARAGLVICFSPTLVELMTTPASQLESIDPAEHVDWVKPRRAMPAWMMSMVVHGLLGTLLLFTVSTVSKGIGDEPARAGSIALAHRSDDQTEYFDGQSADSPTAESTHDAQQTSQAITSSLPAIDLPPSSIGSLLPSGNESLAQHETSGLPAAGGLTQGGATSKGGLGNEGSTSVFGAEGKGSKFVYVFDRSGSMDGLGGRPLAAAKSELIKSLRDLSDTHQFAIIFYNENPHVFSPHGGRPRLLFADEQGKAQAERYVRSLIAGGGTQHMDALTLALNMRPDVIFFLTDAAQPQLYPADFERIRKLNNGTSIHAIEFGFGPYDGKRNFLVRLADENDGKHVYVDITRLRPNVPN